MITSSHQAANRCRRTQLRRLPLLVLRSPQIRARILIHNERDRVTDASLVIVVDDVATVIGLVRCHAVAQTRRRLIKPITVWRPGPGRRPCRRRLFRVLGGSSKLISTRIQSILQSSLSFNLFRPALSRPGTPHPSGLRCAVQPPIRQARRRQRRRSCRCLGCLVD